MHVSHLLLDDATMEFRMIAADLIRVLILPISAPSLKQFAATLPRELRCISLCSFSWTICFTETYGTMIDLLTGVCFSLLPFWDYSF
jgi:hypothetical protein